MGYPPQGPWGPSQPPQGPPYPPQPYGYPPAYPPQRPVPVQQVGKSVTKPAWSIGEICLVVFSCGLALPFVWLSRRSRTTVTRHRR